MPLQETSSIEIPRETVTVPSMTPQHVCVDNCLINGCDSKLPSSKGCKNLAETKQKFDRSALEDLLKRRFYVTPSFQIYGGVAGLYDYGPPGCALLNHLIQVWRNFFIIEEAMLEVDCTCLTPEDVLKTSGHVARFNDLMVKDSITGEFYRVDHLAKAVLQERIKNSQIQTEQISMYETVLSRIDNYTEAELSDLLKSLNLKAPNTGNELTSPEPFNLMFNVSIGPTGLMKGYLRPETAQGIFVNFKRLLDFNNQRMPFAVAQIGRAFRNEISPRAGVLRVREFTMAEVEYFVDPDRKQHSKFSQLAHLTLPLLSSKLQMEDKTEVVSTRLDHAVLEGTINNETLAYFMGRIYQFLLKIGIREDRLRFRQHAPNEMAHYASDCWDAEILTSYGWIECVGCADRSCYDLSCHSKASKVDLVVREDLAQPKTIDVVRLSMDKNSIGKTYRHKAKQLMSKLESFTDDESRSFGECLSREGRVIVKIEDEEIILDSSMVHVESIQKKIHVREYVPSVIEPSFGLGRILYALLEHSYFIRETDEQRAVLGLPAIVAPTKCTILPLSGQAEFEPLLRDLSDSLKRLQIQSKIDDSSGSIGRRYARADELGVPFGITVDFQSLKDASVTLRERDTMEQVRIKINELPSVIKELCEDTKSWTEIKRMYPIFERQEM